MLKLGEKIIYELSEGFSLEGINRYSSAGKKLFITNLGNIIIGSNDDAMSDSGTRYVYSYSEHKIKLSAFLEKEEIVIYDENVPFLVDGGRGSKEVPGNLKIRMSIKDYSLICKNQRDFIFEINDDKCFFVLDDDKVYMGGINKDHEKFVFIGGKNRFEIYYDDIERFLIEGSQISFKGYFHIERESIIARSVQIFANNINRILPRGFEEMVAGNRKIGNLPADSDIVFSRISGNIGGFDYNNSNMLLVRYADNLILINKKTKKNVVSVKFEDCRRIAVGRENIIYDGKNIFRLYLSDKNKEIMDINSIPDVERNDIGFTKSGNPLFVRAEDGIVRFMKSEEKEIMAIPDKDIVDIITIKESDEEKIHKDYSATDIRFKNEYVRVYLKTRMVEKLLRDVFLSSKKDMIEEAGKKEIYRNWAKAMNDMIMYNFFADLYNVRKFVKETLEQDNITDEVRINLVNILYDEVQVQKENIDTLSVYMPDVIEKSGEKLFEREDIKPDRSIYRMFGDTFADTAYMLKDGLNDIEIILGNLDFVLSPSDRRRHVYRMLKENESDKLNLFMEKILKKLNHIIDNMYPYYIREMNEKLYYVFAKLGHEYDKLKADDVKEILFDEITEMYAFGQLMYSEEDDTRRKEIIDQIYKTADKGISGIDSNKFFIGGGRYE